MRARTSGQLGSSIGGSAAAAASRATFPEAFAGGDPELLPTASRPQQSTEVAAEGLEGADFGGGATDNRTGVALSHSVHVALCARRTSKGRQASRGDPKKLYLEPKFRVGGFLLHGATRETFRTEIQSNELL